MNGIKKFFHSAEVLLRSVPATLTSLLVIGVVCMNILANKSIDLNLDWLALDCGIFFSWAVFLVMDIVTKRFGVRAANILSVFALLINFLAAFIFFIVSIIPGTWSQSYVVGSQNIINSALNLTFASSWYVIMGSSVAFIVSAILNNFLFKAVEKAFKKKNFGTFTMASYASTFVAQLVDNLLFALIVSLNFFGWTFVQCFMCALTGAVFELLCEAVFSPFGYKYAKRMSDKNVGKEYLELIGEAQ